MDCYRIKKDAKVKLSDWDPEDKQLFNGNKEEGLLKLAEIKEELVQLQVRLFAEQKNRVIVVLQGMDTSGKDGTIRHVFGGVDPQGIKVATFGKPSTRELAHDYLWRIHQQVPTKGSISIFNRSHYEDILAVRVRQLMPESIWKKRYKHICDFERMLTDEGTTIIKIFLHIDNEEQKQRLIKRKENPAKHWKLFPEDVEDRKLWPDYIEAYEDALEKTHTDYAPWHIIPANRKWYRNIAIAQLMVDTLKKLKPEFPKPRFNVEDIEIR